MNRLITCCLGFGFTFLSANLFAQCAGTEAAVSIDVVTDQYGYEGYWEITAGNGACGANTIASGGNENVGCIVFPEGQTPGGYGNNSTYNEGPWCLELGTQFTLHYRDDYGDGGFTFRIRINGIILQEIAGTGAGDDFTFTVETPPAYNVTLANFVNSTRVMGYYHNTGDVFLSAQLTNLGSEEINSMELNYRIDGGSTITQTVEGLSIANFETLKYTFPNPWNANENGVHSVEMWVSLINGEADQVPANDVLTQQIEVGPAKQDIIANYQSGNSTFEVVANSSDEIDHPTDLDFHPTLSMNQLWVVNKETANSGGTTIVIDNAGLGNQSSEFFQDGNAWHFMSLPTGIAFSNNGNFATSPVVFDANHQGTANAFTGPSLWSGDLTIFAQPSGGNGSHLDMLHESPYSQGVAWEVDNAFWIFDGYSNDIVRYDFVDDHNPGNGYHGDAKVRRFSDVTVLKDPAGIVPSHMVLDDAKQWLYAVDNGNRRVIRIDINTGVVSSTPPAYGPHEDMVEYVTITGYTWETVITAGLERPAGIEIMGSMLLVSDYETGKIHVYNVDATPATELFTIQTPAQGIMGLIIAPDGKIMYADHEASEIVSVTPGPLSVNDMNLNAFIYPNPSSGGFTIGNQTTEGLMDIRIFDISGRIVFNINTVSPGSQVNPNLNPGTYLIEVMESGTKRNTVLKYIQTR
ncbi:MAG: T9SS type A sorting domain-containing protein [Bacteroidia bacterium]